MPATFAVNTTRTLGYRVLRGVLQVVWRLAFRPLVVGLENIPAEGPVLIAPSHRSNLDFAYLIFVTPRKTFFMAKDSLWKVPVLGRLLTTMGAFPVRRGSADRDAMKSAEEVVIARQALVLFPEGTRRAGNTIDDLHDGAMFIAARHGAVVIPVGIAGTERALPSGAKFPKFVRTAVVVGAPVLPPPTEGRVSRSELAHATERLQAGLQAAYDDAVRML